MATSSPVPAAFNNLQEEIAYYKHQYEHLESELQDFQASSRELEAELERDVEASEKRERGLKEKVESLTYEVDEWKTKHKQSKTEANNVQNSLQKEITQLRETNRTQQLRLRDIEVANDDYERQARHTTSSLEDMESKYNQAIERGVMLEEEMKTSEQEREALRIEAQRIRDELSDLKIEAEITQEKLRAAEEANARHHKHGLHLHPTRDQELQSPTSEGSVTSASLRSTFTPERPKSRLSNENGSDAITPPSPPLSEQSNSKQNIEQTGEPHIRDLTASRDPHLTPKPTASVAATRAIHTREKSRTGPNRPPPVFAKPRATGVPRPRTSNVHTEGGVPRSESLYQIRGLIGKMQKLEQRVHSARSKLPAPTNTPPRASPRGGTPTPSTLSNEVPSNVTVRSSRKRGSGSTATSATPSQTQADEGVRKLNRRQSRISFSGPSAATPNYTSRPTSRASNASNGGFARPSSRVETYARPTSAAEARRPRSSLAGRETPSKGHRQSLSMYGDGEGNEDSFITPTPRRTTEKFATAIPGPSSLARRQSNQALASGTTPGRRKSIKQIQGGAEQGSKSAVPRPSIGRKSTELGETF